MVELLLQNPWVISSAVCLFTAAIPLHRPRIFLFAKPTGPEARVEEFRQEWGAEAGAAGLSVGSMVIILPKSSKLNVVLYKSSPFLGWGF